MLELPLRLLGVQHYGATYRVKQDIGEDQVSSGCHRRRGGSSSGREQGPALTSEVLLARVTLVISPFEIPQVVRREHLP